MTAKDDFYSVVDREARNDAERHESRVLFDALERRRSEVGGVAQIPARDEKLSEKILTEAKKRSVQITASRQASVSQALQTPSQPIPWWLWLAWLVAIAAVVAAFSFYG
jgi:hypothetical protein